MCNFHVRPLCVDPIILRSYPFNEVDHVSVMQFMWSVRVADEYHRKVLSSMINDMVTEN